MKEEDHLSIVRPSQSTLPKLMGFSLGICILLVMKNLENFYEDEKVPMISLDSFIGHRAALIFIKTHIMPAILHSRSRVTFLFGVGVKGELNFIA